MSKEAENKEPNKVQVSHVFREALVPEPSEKENNGGWITWGDRNLYGQFLNKLFVENPVHGGIIGHKVKYITSGGLDYKGSDLTLWETIKKNGLSKMDLQESVVALSTDDEIADEYYIHWKKDINGFWTAEIADFELIRNSLSGEVFYYCENWKSPTAAKSKARSIKSIDTLSFLNNKENETEGILYYSSKAKQYELDNGKLTCNIYPVPNYAGGIVSIMAGIEMIHYNYAESVNAFTGGAVLNMNNGIPEPDDKTALEKEIKGDVTKRSKKGGFIILYNDGKERACTIEYMQGNDNANKYTLTKESIREDIMIAHGVINPALFGIKTPNGLGNTGDELKASYILFKENYVLGRQNRLLSGLNYGHKNLNGMQGEIFFKDYMPDFDVQESDNETVNLLNKLPIILQNAVVNAMSPAQKLALIGLTVDPTATPPPTGAEFKSADPILNAFMAVGTPKSNLSFVQGRKVEDFNNLDAEEQIFRSMFSSEKFVKLDSDSKKILGLLAKDVSYNDIIIELGKKPGYVSGKIAALEENGYISRDKSGKTEVTKSGKDSISDESKFKIYYTYELREDAPELVPGGSSREFCTFMVDADKAFTRDEINQISNDQGSDVWLYRGGWLKNKDTDKNEPACRHVWKMNLVIS